jgi:antitoxin VapB
VAIFPLLFDVTIPVKTFGRDALVHPKTVFLDHGRFFGHTPEDESIGGFANFEIHARAQSKPLPKRFWHHNATGPVDLQRHTINNGTWQNLWQGLVDFEEYGILPNGGTILQSLNLKNPRAYLLASELSQLTGESLTAVVITALEQRLEAERRKRGSRTTAEKILAFAKRFAPGMAPGSRSADHATELYGDDGMPR